jgi:hypothetical protein
MVHGLYDAMLLVGNGSLKIVADTIYLILPFAVLLMFIPLRAREIAQAQQQAPIPVVVAP